MNKLIIGAGLAAIIAIPAIAVAQIDRTDPHASHTRAEVQAKIAERFAAVDANKDGVVTRAEFDAYREKMKAERESRRAERREAMFARLDTDKNGQISKAEFMAERPDGPDGRDHGPGGAGHGPGGMGGMHGMRGHHPGGPGWGMGGMGGMGEDWFARLDANKDGKVTLAEASAKALAVFDRADANKDGTVTPEERKAAFEAMRAEWRAKRGG